MLELLDSLSSENLVMICLVLGIIALCLSIGISFEIYSTGNKTKYKSIRRDNTEDTQTRLNIKESANVKYVEENSELEKTKAKLELEQLREKLKREEEEKNRLIAINAELEKKKQEETIESNKIINNDIEILEDTIVNMKPIKQVEFDVKEQVKDNEPYKYVELEKTKELNIPAVSSVEVANDEDDAIISYNELKNAKNFGYTDEEMYNNVDEEDAIISVQELEKLYNESAQINVSLNNEEKQETIENNNYNVNSYTSQVYGYSKTDQDLMLEQTANLEKLNEEIRKTNEFLKMLKDLKKNLD